MWNTDDLFAKAAVLVRRGLNHDDPDSTEVPLWCFIAIEMLARSVLAETNVALLADPSDGNNILFACGFPSTKSPKSIPAKTVFHRCTVVCPDFTSHEYDTCMIWMNWRNEELHSGALPLDGLRSSEWMPRFFQISSILLDHIKRSMEDFIGSDQVDTAQTMIEALSEDNKKKAFAQIKAAKEDFQAHKVEVRLGRIQEGKKRRHEDYLTRSMGHELACPACEGPAVISGDIVRSTTPHDEDGEFVQEDVRIPTKLKCYSCDLQLSGHSLLHAIGQGDQFTKTDYLDPKDYYGIEFDPEDYFDAGYMND